MATGGLVRGKGEWEEVLVGVWREIFFSTIMISH